MRNDIPRPTLPRGTLELEGGERIEYRSLSRAQAIALNDYQGRPDAGEDWIIACGLEVTVDEAHAWRDAVTVAVGGQLVEAIIEISGLTVADVRDALKAEQVEDDDAPAPKD